MSFRKRKWWQSRLDEALVETDRSTEALEEAQARLASAAALKPRVEAVTSSIQIAGLENGFSGRIRESYRQSLGLELGGAGQP